MNSYFFFWFCVCLKICDFIQPKLDTIELQETQIKAKKRCEEKLHETVYVSKQNLWSRGSERKTECKLLELLSEQISSAVSFHLCKFH